MSQRSAYRLLSLLGDLRAAQRGPGPYARRKVRSYAMREFAQALRRVVKP